MSKIYSKEISFSTLKKNFDDGIYAIPLLQRNYVWDKNRVCLLIDSIYNHYPIGVSLIWKARSNKIAEIKPNNKSILPSFNINNRKIDFIIDGQQRLTSIYGLINGINEIKDFNSNINFNKIYFVLDKTKEKRFIYLNRYDIKRKECIPVHDVLKDPSNRLKIRYNLNNSLMREVDKLKQRLRTYKFHFLYIETDALHEVRDTFIRINSQGMTVGKADALFARTTNIGLRDLVDEIRRAFITKRYHEMNPEAIIYMLPLSKGEKEVGKRSLDKFARNFDKQHQLKSSFQREWKKYKHSFSRAVDFLTSEFGVTTYKLLPSDNIFTLLSLFFFFNKKRPSVRQKNEIRKWFWHTTIGERYSGSAFNRNIAKDIDFFKKLANRQNHSYVIGEKINPNEFLKRDYRKTNYSAVKGYYLFLKSLKPKYLEVNYPMMLDNAVSPGNRKDRHHIFPRAILNRKKINSKWKDSILNICFLAANENQSIHDNHPTIYLNEFKRKHYFRSVMKTHLIPVTQDSGVWEKRVKMGFAIFLNKRATLILNAIAKTAGVRRNQLFEKLEEIKRT